MLKRRGSFLEESVSVLFKKAGFNSKLNTWIKGYEVDVLAYKAHYRIAIECKQYEASYISIRNILHQWASKKNILNVDKVVVVIAGQKPTREDYALADELDVTLLDGDMIHKLNYISDSERLKNELNNSIRFDENLYKRQVNKRFKIVGYIASFCYILALVLFIYETETRVYLLFLYFAIFSTFMLVIVKFLYWIGLMK